MAEPETLEQAYCNLKGKKLAYFIHLANSYNYLLYIADIISVSYASLINVTENTSQIVPVTGD